jgi:hypothetical protein
MLQTNSWQYRTIEAVLNAKKDLEADFTTMRDCGSIGAMYSDTDGRRAIKDGFGSWSAIVDEVHSDGVKAACHTAGGATLRDSIEEGCDSIELAVDIDPESISKVAEKGIFLVTDLSNKKPWEPAVLKAPRVSGGQSWTKRVQTKPDKTTKRVHLTVETCARNLLRE